MPTIANVRPIARENASWSIGVVAEAILHHMLDNNTPNPASDTHTRLQSNVLLYFGRRNNQKWNYQNN